MEGLNEVGCVELNKVVDGTTLGDMVDGATVGSNDIEGADVWVVEAGVGVKEGYNVGSYNG